MTYKLGRIVKLISVAAISLNMFSVTHAQSLEEVLAGDHRSEANKARDKYRNPVETLNFFGIKDNMTVVEIAPGGGWYQEVLAPYLNRNGKYVSATSDEGTDGYKREQARLAANPELYGNVTMVPLSGSVYGEENSADMVLSFRNYHNWTGRSEFEKLRAFYKTLKPGGILGMVDHRSNDAGDGNGYTCEPCMIKDAEAIGFIYLGTSQINANPKDPKDHPGGVWNLPPVLSKNGLDENNLEEIQNGLKAIGESDRYTLKFAKPMH
ncbi:class I SAM-dependent methyltransferase [Pseudemcibacter aquimaris]|uniref:class I SAM-dependent methyltransferase n=1 Tax=Pseudemcibacter aquimaris TaxID=2857064 RepID=UPI00201281E9|nr:hypothetical protein [Pseudemcibacter aquimaris]MCC3860173.1 hypothetical protein [Pseudemcibacter aquimaris]WDU57499.1 hypothetical protein KW060_09860 [Pseudemcibacter aquimaris]